MKFKLAVVLSLAFSSFCSHAKPQSVDKVTAIVNQDVVLKSEVDAIVKRVTENAQKNNQQLPSEHVLRRQAIERLIQTSLMMQMAERMGFNIADAQLDSAVAGIAQEQNLSISQLRQKIEGEGQSFAAFREELRKEMITQEVERMSVQRRVYISEQEVDSLLRLIDQQGQKNEEYNIGHILIEVPNKATAEEIESARQRAEKVIELLNKGEDFKKIAITSSSGQKALEGGQWGWIDINEMPTLFAEVVKGKAKDSLLGPIRSGAGFHIIKVQDIRGREVVEVEEINARHILIKPSIVLSEEKAKKMLEEFAEQVKAGKADFAELAKQNSADPGSALRGGELGFTDPRKYVKAFRDNLAKLKDGEYSAPFRSEHGWHLVQVLGRRMQDKTDETRRNRAYGMIFNRKFAEELSRWQSEMRSQAYVDVLEE